MGSFPFFEVFSHYELRESCGTNIRKRPSVPRIPPDSLIRTVARTEFPSTSEAMLCARFALDNVFMRIIMPKRFSIVEEKKQMHITLYLPKYLGGKFSA